MRPKVASVAHGLLCLAFENLSSASSRVLRRSQRVGGFVSSIIFQNVSFGYDSSRDGILSGVSFGASEGWTGIIGANGSGKTTLLRLACGELEPRGGLVLRPRRSVYCPQRTDEPMDGFVGLLEDLRAEAYRLRGRLGIEDDWLSRWSTLSHGERKRAQVATCLWLEPDLLAVDEPTNHLDRAASELIRRALRSFRGIGFLVSHDRELLDDLCAHSLFVAPERVVFRSGGYTVARAAVLEEDRLAREAQAKARREERRLKRELTVRREHQRKADRGRSKRGIDRKDHDAKEKVDRARIGDSGAGKRLRQLEGRIDQASAKQEVGPLLRRTSLGISLTGRASERNTLFRLPASVMTLGEGKRLAHDTLIVQPRDRIGIAGPNGSGKSTLIRRIVEQQDLARSRVVYIPQEIDEAESAEVIEGVRRLSGDALGRTMAWVSRLGSDPARLLESRLPSPGEVRKLLLATNIARSPELIIMDEPTNHMDLPSIECVESALGEYVGGLLLVSHDIRFLDALTTLRWRTAPDPEEPGSFRLIREIVQTPKPESGELPGGGRSA